ncbi:hypothetical protein H4Q26_014614 [Puccinia striiformis f. sp. tritici PST-130]|nr:hypothetical protein H4Q26_014614 [Puccinia striiformis f. sp. tritici PST-130]
MWPLLVHTLRKTRYIAGLSVSPSQADGVLVLFHIGQNKTAFLLPFDDLIIMKSSIHNSTTSPPEGTNDSVPAEDRSTPEPIESDTNDKNHNPSGKRALGDASTEESTSGSESTNEASEVELESWLSLSTLPTQPELLNPVGNDAQGTSTTSNNHDRPTHHEISLWFAGLWNYNKQSYTQTEKKFIHLEEKER